MKKVLCIRFSSFGDVLLTLPAVSAFREKFQQTQIHFLTKEKFREAPEVFLGTEVKIHTLPNHASLTELVKLARELKKENFECVYDLHNNLRSRVLCVLLGVPVQRISKHRTREFILFFLRKWGRRLFQRSVFLRKKENFKLLGVEEKFPEEKIFPVSNLQGAFTITAPYICLSSETAWATKNWGFANFKELARKISQTGVKVVWLGLKQEESVQTHEDILDFRGKLSLKETCAVLAQAQALICNDTGLMHLSEILGTKVYGIFGPTTRELGFAPVLCQSKIIEAENLWCRPCSKNGKSCHRLSYPQKCLSLISVDQVFKEL